MEAMNRAIEDASYYMEFQRKLIQSARDHVAVRNQLSEELTLATKKPMGSPRRPGENREQHRARVFAGRESA